MEAGRSSWMSEFLCEKGLKIIDQNLKNVWNIFCVSEVVLCFLLRPTKRVRVQDMAPVQVQFKVSQTLISLNIY